jgi:hypothetical protein
MMPRLHVILAVAWRDLSSQLRGRRGWVLPVITLVLLAPLAAAPVPRVPLTGTGPLPVSGDVPTAVLELDDTFAVRRGGMRFRQEGGTLVVVADEVRDSVRAALDGDRPVVQLVATPHPPLPLPGRTLLLALLASSILTGAVSESLPGERGRGSLEALLTAAVTRSEVVLGKWFAWAAFGSIAATAAAVFATALGRMELGPWIIALPTVPLGTVALGLFLVRGARDVVGGATISLRVLPAMLSILGITAWFIGLGSPALGAAVPLGGALVAAGGTWEGWLPPVVGAGVTVVGSAALLAWTARDLERMGAASTGPSVVAVVMGLVWVTLGWWGGIASAVAWGPAGNGIVATKIPLEAGVVAGALALFIVAAIRAGHAREPGTLLGLVRPQPWTWFIAVAVGALLGPVLATETSFLPADATLAALLAGDAPATTPFLNLLAARASLGLSPGVMGPAVAILALLAQEFTFRGWLQRQGRWGPWLAGIAFVVVVAPLDPVGGVLLAAALGGMAKLGHGSVWLAIIARLAASGVAAIVPELPWAIAIGSGVAAVALAWALVVARRR